MICKKIMGMCLLNGQLDGGSKILVFSWDVCRYTYTGTGTGTGTYICTQKHISKCICMRIRIYIYMCVCVCVGVISLSFDRWIDRMWIDRLMAIGITRIPWSIIDTIDYRYYLSKRKKSFTDGSILKWSALPIVSVSIHRRVWPAMVNTHQSLSSNPEKFWRSTFFVWRLVDVVSDTG